MIHVHTAILELAPNAHCSVINESVDNIIWNSPDIPQPRREEILEKLAELQAAEPLRQLRTQRNQLLAQTDWRMTTDYPYNDQAEWASYRTELRNLPQTSNPTLDEQGNLIVNWPQTPDAV